MEWVVPRVTRMSSLSMLSSVSKITRGILDSAREPGSDAWFPVVCARTTRIVVRAPLRIAAMEDGEVVYEPSQDKLREEIARIQANWSEADRRKRLVCKSHGSETCDTRRFAVTAWGIEVL